MWHEIQDDRVLNGAAALAFFLVLAIFPAAIFVLALLPYLSIPHLQQAIMDLLRQVLTEQSASFFEGPVRHITSEKSGTLLAAGLTLSLWSASTGVYAIMQQFNSAYDIKESRPFWKARGTAVILMLLLVLLVIGSMTLVIFGGAVQWWLAAHIGWSRPLLMFFVILRWIIILAALLLGVSVIYRFGPAAHFRFRFISTGSAVAAALIVVASVGFRLYLFYFADYSATYGSLGAMIILMVWLYLAGIALLLGCKTDSLLRQGKSPIGR